MTCLVGQAFPFNSSIYLGLVRITASSAQAISTPPSETVRVYRAWTIITDRVLRNRLRKLSVSLSIAVARSGHKWVKAYLAGSHVRRWSCNGAQNHSSKGEDGADLHIERKVQVPRNSGMASN
jgi:hypothetical protein